MSALVADETIPERAVAGPARCPADLASARASLAAHLDSEGLEPRNVYTLLGPLETGARAAAEFLLADGVPASHRDVRLVLERLEDVLGVDLGAERLTSRIVRVGHRLADALGALAMLFAGYIVIGGLAEGDSLLLGKSAGPLGLALLLVMVSTLGLFEALHTSATMLKIADLSALAERHPRAAALHRTFHSDSGLARFLAGRQMVVILTVFICSPLTSFPHLTHWPLASAPLPAFVQPVVAVGLPGALFVLWFGQLVPQFLASRHAVRLTDTRIVTLAFRAAYGLESLGLARPGFWMAAWDKATQTLPGSPARRWREAAEELVGYGATAIVREWIVRSVGSELHASSSNRIFRPGIDTVTDGTLLAPAGASQIALAATAARGERPLPLRSTLHREERLPNGDARFHKAISGAVGSYRPGDVLRVALDADYRTDPGRDIVYIARQVRFVLLRIEVDHIPQAITAATLRTYAVGDDLADRTELGIPLALEPTITDEGCAVIEHVVHFPAPGTLLTLDWEVTPDV